VALTTPRSPEGNRPEGDRPEGDRPAAERAGRLTLAEARGRGVNAQPQGAYARLVIRHVSPFASWAIVRFTPLSADAVTTLSILCGVAAAGFVVVQAAWANLVAVALLHAAYLFDCADGEVARIRGTAGLRGKYLDLIGHMIQNRVLYAACAIVLVEFTGGSAWALAVGLLAVSFVGPFGLYAAGQVLGRPVIAPEHASESEPRDDRADPLEKVGSGAPAGTLPWLYRRVAFVWNYPASMNLLSLALLADAAWLVASADAQPVFLPVTFLMFGASLALKQVGHAIRLLWAAEWRLPQRSSTESRG